MGNILCGLEPMGGDTKKGAVDWIGLGVELVEDMCLPLSLLQVTHPLLEVLRVHDGNTVESH